MFHCAYIKKKFKKKQKQKKTKNENNNNKKKWVMCKNSAVNAMFSLKETTHHVQVVRMSFVKDA